MLTPCSGHVVVLSRGATGSSPHRPACLFPAPLFPSSLFRSAPAGIPGKALAQSKYPPVGTCSLEELSHFGRVFLPYAHFLFLPSTLSLTRMSPSPLPVLLLTCGSHFSAEKPIKSFQAPSMPGPGAVSTGRTVSSAPGAGPRSAPPAPTAPWRHLLSFPCGSSFCYSIRDNPSAEPPVKVTLVMAPSASQT